MKKGHTLCDVLILSQNNLQGTIIEPDSYTNQRLQ